MISNKTPNFALNCDLGESFGAWTMGLDADVMPLIDSANIACGGHAGDPLTMLNTLKLAKEHQVTAGAHPSYPDLIGFGRRAMSLSSDELYATLLSQISTIDGVAASIDWPIQYVKPHGALYNAMMKDTSVLQTIIQAVSDFHRPLALMIQATEHGQAHQQIADEYKVPLLFEAFADRAYTDDGLLVPRNQPGAVLDEDAIQQRVDHLLATGTITSINQTPLTLKIDSLCVHGDTPDALAAVRLIRQRLNQR